MLSPDILLEDVEATANQHNNDVVVTIQPKKQNKEEEVVPAEFSESSDTTAASSSTGSSNASFSVNNEDDRKSLLSNSSSSSSLRRLEQELSDALEQQKHKRRSSVQMVALWNDLGMVCRDAGNLEQAERYYQQALKLCSKEEEHQQQQQQQQVGPEEDHDLVDSLSAMLLGNLGLVSSDLGKRTEAVQLYRRALDKLKEGPPSQSSDTATTHPSKQNHRQLNTARTLNNLGTLSAEQGQYDEARKYFQQALDLYQQTLVPQQDISDDSTTTISSSSSSSSSSGRGTVKLGRRQLDDRLKTPDVGLCYHNLGRLCLDQQQFEEAALYLETALHIHDFHHQQQQQKTNARYAQLECVSQKPRMATLEDLGELCVEMGRFAKALDYYQQVLGILQQQQSNNADNDEEEDHASIQEDLERILGILGSLSYELGQLEQSRDYFLRVLESSVDKHQQRQGDEDLLGTLEFLSEIASQLGQAEEVSLYQQKIDQIQLKREEGLGLEEEKGS